MNATLQAKLERIARYATRYEWILTDGTTTYLVVYGCKSRSGIFRALRERDNERAKRIVEITGRDTFDSIKHGAITIGNWTLKTSGRTQRDCYIAGENTYILS